MKKIIIFLGILIASSVFSLCQADALYTITDLGTLGGTSSASLPIE